MDRLFWFIIMQGTIPANVIFTFVFINRIQAINITYRQNVADYIINPNSVKSQCGLLCSYINTYDTK